MKMVCRRCRIEYDESRGPACPSCGAPGLLKTSAILIAAGSTAGVYSSLKEVPRPLRTRLIESTTGVNSGTILIADRQGRRQILRALRRLPRPAAEPAAIHLRAGGAETAPGAARSCGNPSPGW